MFATNYLIPRYVDTVKFNSQEYPSAVHCLVGVVHTLGLSGLVRSPSNANKGLNILQNVGCFCMCQKSE